MDVNTNKAINFFLAQIKYDKEYAEKMVTTDHDWYAIAGYLYDKTTILCYTPSEESSWVECVDFIDGNGFKITGRRKLLNHKETIVLYVERE